MRNYIIGFVFFAGMILMSCGDQLDLEPANSITDEQILAILASGDEAKIEWPIPCQSNSIPVI